MARLAHRVPAGAGPERSFYAAAGRSIDEAESIMGVAAILR
jgi:hypothetical protein